MGYVLEPFRQSGEGVSGDAAVQPDVFFYYRGYFSQAVVEASADAIRSRLAASQANYRNHRRLVGAFIEVGQNIVHYSADVLSDPAKDVDEVRFGAVCIRQAIDGFILTCFNPMSRDSATQLQPKLARLSQMGLDEIRRSYRDALKADGEADSKGGGMGLLTLARDSRKPLDYAFTPSDVQPDVVIFHLTVTL